MAGIINLSALLKTVPELSGATEKVDRAAVMGTRLCY